MSYSGTCPRELTSRVFQSAGHRGALEFSGSDRKLWDVLPSVMKYAVLSIRNTQISRHLVWVLEVNSEHIRLLSVSKVLTLHCLVSCLSSFPAASAWGCSQCCSATSQGASLLTSTLLWFWSLASSVLYPPRSWISLSLSFHLGWPFLDPHSKKLIPLRNEEELRVSWNNCPSYRGSPGKAVAFDRHVKKDIGKP